MCLSDSRLEHLIIRIQILILHCLKQVFIELLLRVPRHDPHVTVAVDVEEHRVTLRIDELDELASERLLVLSSASFGKSYCVLRSK